MAIPGASVGTYVFFLITGYFSIDRRRISLKKTILEMSFYGFFLWILSLIVIVTGVNLKEGTPLWYGIKGIVAPISSNMWWFATSYVLLILITPYINSFFNRLNKKGIILILTFTYLVSELNIIASTEYKLLVFPVFYYLIGASIKRYKNIMSWKAEIKVVIFLLLWIFISMSYIPQYLPELSSGFLRGMITADICNLARNTVLIPACTTFLFLLFLNMPEFHSSKVNHIAATTFGIYLFHDSGVMRQLVWNNILHIDKQYGSDLFVLWVVISVIGVFAVGMFVDLLRMKFIEPIQNKIYKHLIGKVLS